MGDPKKAKKRYFTPAHPWNKVAIEEEGKLKKDYGLKNKKEIYIASSFLKKYKDIIDRRLQSIVCKKGLAKTMNQARQFIVHRHIAIGDKEITSPAYILPLEEESKMVFRSTSTLSAEDHPERMTSPAQSKADKKAAVPEAAKQEASA